MNYSCNFEPVQLNLKFPDSEHLQMPISNQLFSLELLEFCFKWACKQRRHYHYNTDIWDVCFHWLVVLPRLYQLLITQQYHFSPLQRIKKASGETIHLWGTLDAIVLKALAQILSQLLPSSTRCMHLKGNGGIKQVCKEIRQALPEYQFVFRTDIYHYYESIDHHQLIDKSALYIKDKFLLRLLWFSMHRTVERGGLYQDIIKGLPRGSPLSPLLGAFYLYELDQALEQEDCYYIRYMDDILILTKTRWKNRRAIAKFNAIISALGLKQHPDKTSMGKISKGFDFLGLQFVAGTVLPCKKALQRFSDKLNRLYEQEPDASKRNNRLGQYIKRWKGWYIGITQSITDSVLALLNDITNKPCKLPIAQNPNLGLTS
ncbi:MAG: reverse transcriptase/maturase family protein [gamma proteobacterium symbiont of Taylorina sp.]|nr:reverse transcriptase/maturase family protein [gamma proteobacterium symbiont of Taylorina sp.]